MKKILFSKVFLLIFASLSFASAQAEEAAKAGPGAKTEINVRDIQPSDVIQGKADAPVTIIEYASLTCPHCAGFHANVLPELQTRYIDTGIVRYVFRHFPLDEPALRASMLVECGGSEHHHRLLATLFKTQTSWAGKKDYRTILENIGKLAGLTGEQINVCFNNKELETRLVEQKIHAAQQLQIQATPSFVINGLMHAGAKPVSYFIAAIEKARPSAQQPAAGTTAGSKESVEKPASPAP
jgi:protein-disulfide isomerase